LAYLSVTTKIHSPQEWELSDLYKGFDDPQFEQDLQALLQKAAVFRQNYCGQVNHLTPEEIARCLQQLEALSEKYSYLDTFVTLVLCADPRNTETKQYLDEVKIALTRIQNQLLFFNLELQDLEHSKFEELQASPALQDYSHYLNRLTEFRAHRLPEEGERTRNRDSITGRQAFLELYLVHRGGQDYESVTMPDGNTVEIEAELEALLFHPDAGVRYDAYRSLRQGMEPHNRLYGFILNTIAQDHRIESQMRGYPSTFYKQLLASEVPESVFRAVMDGTGDRFNLFQGYYQLKGKALGQKIRTCDLHAPWTADEQLLAVDYKTGVETLLEALKHFDILYANRAADYFSNRWVDAKVRAGKGSGVFHFPTYPKHSYLLLSYTNEYHSLFTLAEQLGQGLHFARACDRQTYFNSKPPLMLAEVAANFNKLLLLDYLLKQAGDDKRLRQVLLTQQLEDHLNLLFGASTISRLEVAIHERAIPCSFDHHFVNEQWLKLYRELCGDAVEVLPEHQYDWARINQIYTKPFSAYQYTAASIVSLVCYQKYQETGADFILGYLDLLGAGGSMNQVDALRKYVEVDIEDPTTISGALDYVEELIEELQQ
jgi:oligoendopeptidase F